jgi:hypothetical protein
MDSNIAPVDLSGNVITSLDDNFAAADFFMAVPLATYSTIYNAPIISGISPNTSYSMGNNIAITITGSGFYNITAATINGTNITSLTYTDTTIHGTMLVPFITSESQTYNINITTFLGTNLNTSANVFTVNNKNTSCYNKNTKILCLDENTHKEIYVPIQNIKRGNMVKTYLNGYRRVKYIGSDKLVNCPEVWNKCMYVLPKCGNMTEDLIITGNHSILMDSNHKSDSELKRENKLKMNTSCDINGYTVYKSNCLKIEDKFTIMAAISDKFEKVMDRNTYTYYHLVVDDDDELKRFGIWANGVLSETESKFHFLKHKFNHLQ